MNSMRAAVLWAHLLRGAAPHDSPLDTLVAASRGTARVAEKVCFAGASALCLPLLPAGNSNLCGGRTCYVPDRAVLSDAASVGRTDARWNGIATPFRAEGMLGKNAPHLPAAGWLDMVQHGTLRFWVCIRGNAAGEILEVKAAKDECEEQRTPGSYPNKAACGCSLGSLPATHGRKRGADGGPAATATRLPWALRVTVSTAGALATLSVAYDGLGVPQIFQEVEDAFAERPRVASYDDVLGRAWKQLDDRIAKCPARAQRLCTTVAGAVAALYARPSRDYVRGLARSAAAAAEAEEAEEEEEEEEEQEGEEEEEEAMDVCDAPVTRIRISPQQRQYKVVGGEDVVLWVAPALASDPPPPPVSAIVGPRLIPGAEFTRIAMRVVDGTTWFSLKHPNNPSVRLWVAEQAYDPRREAWAGAAQVMWLYPSNPKSSARR
jgi:hypothetical protein